MNTKRFQPRNQPVATQHVLDAQPGRDQQAMILPISNIRSGQNIRSNLGDLTELMQSIQAYGILNPLLIAKTALGLELVGGHRRLECAKRLELKAVPVRLILGEPGVLALLDNLQRENLSGWDTCRAIHELLPLFNTQRELATAINKDESYVSKCIAIVKAQPELERVQVLSLHDLFANMGAAKDPRKPSGAIPAGRFGAEGAIHFKERPDGKSFTLRLNWDASRTPEDSKAKMISTLETILQKLRSS